MRSAAWPPTARRVIADEGGGAVAIGRRRFIGLIGGAAAGAAIGLPVGRLFSDVLHSADQPLDPPRGPEDFVLSVCTACPGGCGIRARRIGGRVVNVAGNP